VIAAIYARKSNEQNRRRRSEKRRPSDRARAGLRGPEGLGRRLGVRLRRRRNQRGAFRRRPPGLARLLNTVSPRPPFDVLIMSEESRLGREAIETGWTLKQITDAGVRVFFYLEDQERTLDTAMNKVMLSLSTFASEMEREKARQRIRDALLRKARAGHVVGGILYGYRNVPVMHGDRRSHTERVVVAEEAAVIRRIFEMPAAGVGYQRIALRLNEERVPAPVPRRRGRPRGWAPSTIREMLFASCIGA
jgi:DNA invertase Pin-like site-specific DNA recombinase